MQLDAKRPFSNIGAIKKDACILNSFAINFGEAHERPEGLEEAAEMMVGLEVKRVRQGLAILATQSGANDRSALHGIRRAVDYSMTDMRYKVIFILNSYTDYINRVLREKC